MKIIPTSKGNYAMVDDDDYEWLSKYSWYDSKGYASTNLPNKNNEKMHRMIMNPPDDRIIDHINGNTSDNRKENLRIATPLQNSWNSKKKKEDISSSKYKGVSIEKGRYRVRIFYNEIKETIGSFDDEIAAANAYNYYAIKYFGEFARLNNVPFMEKEEWEKHDKKYTSEFKGVSYRKDIEKWQVQIYDNETKKSSIVGTFEDELVAANYYNHLMNKKINQCELIEYKICEELKSKSASVYKGVFWNSKRSKWAVTIFKDDRYKTVGYFDDEVYAANYYNHLMGRKINHCEYFSLEECENQKFKRKRSSEYNGVSWFKRDEVWESNVFYKGKKYYIGRYKTEIEAALAYNDKVIELNIKDLYEKLNKIELIKKDD